MYIINLGESSVDPRIRNGTSRRYRDISVLVHLYLAFLTFTDDNMVKLSRIIILYFILYVFLKP